MRFFRGWINTHRKELHGYAFYRVPNNTEVSLFPRLLWIWAIQLAAFYFGFKSKPIVPWWTMCILSVVTTAVLLVAYYCERYGKIDGFFRYSSVFCILIGLSLIELIVFIAIRKTVQYSLIYSLVVLLLTVACLVYSIYRQINRGNFSEKTEQAPSAAPFIAVALGLGTHEICKNLISENVETFFIVIAAGFLVGIAFGLAAAFWLKSIGAKQQ